MFEMQEIKEVLIEKIRMVVNRVDKGYSIDVYGSHRTGLCMYWSDVDLVVNPAPNDSIQDARECL
jgi:DNA polymerase sigma